MIKFEELIKLNIGSGFCEAHPEVKNLRLKSKRIPESIVQKEADYLYNIIVENNLII